MPIEPRHANIMAFLDWPSIPGHAAQALWIFLGYQQAKYRAGGESQDSSFKEATPMPGLSGFFFWNTNAVRENGIQKHSLGQAEELKV